MSVFEVIDIVIKVSVLNFDILLELKSRISEMLTAVCIRGFLVCF